MSARVEVSIRVNAGAERAFDVFVKEIGAWWRSNEMFAFTPRSPGRLAFEPGPGGRLTETLANGTAFEIGRITAWEPGRRLAFSWRQASFAPDQMTHVEVRFEPVGDQTRVTVIHTGWETVPPEHVARHGFPDAVFLKRHGEWWRALLVSYESSVV